MVQQLKETGHPVFKGVSALSRGVLKQKKGKTSIHFRRDSMNTELLFQTVSENQLSINGAVANWCGSTEDKGTSNYYVGQQDLDQVETRRSSTLGLSSENSNWKQDARKSQGFEFLTGQIHLTQLCVKTFIQNLVASRKTYRIRPNADDGWWTLTLVCREYSSSRSYPKAQPLAAIPEGTIVGPVLEVHIAKILEEFGIEVAIPSIANSTYTSYVVKSKEAERFVNEIHNQNEELRTSTELLTDLQGSVKMHHVKKQKEVRVTKKIMPTLSTIRLKELPCTHKEPFLQMRGNERSLTQLHQMEDTQKLLYPRWLQTCCATTIKKKDKRMVQDIGKQPGQHWWKRLHEKHEALMMDIG